MRKSPLLLATFATLVVSAHATSLSGSDWNFDYKGHYSVVNADVSGLGLTSVLGATLGAQLALLNGGVTASQGVTLTQSDLSTLTTSALDFSAQGSSALLPSVGSFLYAALNANDGVYGGTMAGSTLTLAKSPLVGATVDGTGVIDTRVAGVGVVIDLRATVPTNSMTGTADVIQGPAGTYGTPAIHVAGTAGLASTLGLQARATTYSLGLGGITSTTTGYVNVGAIQSTADSWSLSRSPQAVPEPASIATIGLGALGLLRRRSKRA